MMSFIFQPVMIPPTIKDDYHDSKLGLQQPIPRPRWQDQLMYSAKLPVSVTGVIWSSSKW